jgi:hypothetical protein
MTAHSLPSGLEETVVLAQRLDAISNSGAAGIDGGAAVVWLQLTSAVVKSVMAGPLQIVDTGTVDGAVGLPFGLEDPARSAPAG